MTTGLVVLAAASVALAAHPIKGATYKGTFGTSSISFKVAANGKKVSVFNFPVPPIGCQGGTFGSASGGSATVSKKGTFKVTLKLVFAPLHRTNGKLVVTGKFQKGGKESGKVSSIFTNPVFPPNCDKPEPYSTKGLTRTGG